ncbi:ribbon-helix-helix protein, CopG family [Nocardioides immobilis]|uniref:Ribbon-helix-helix protein, CopG family n=1 Tax=Nocardioides immobilis TaxID=2049295 RepID=A0A417Y6M1_9ACTN|nr:ribbon-helix-helix protein, CopG family [Nocardioides immobilis]RHW28245.1 ribbon-helix-helix protein, CopG family [Nocardioides immobilis]
MAMTLRLTDEQTAALRATADREGRSMHETVVRAIAEYVAKRGEKRDALIKRILEEDREALDRLGSV